MSDQRLNSLSCYVFPGHIRDCRPEFTERYNTAYDFWRVFMGYEMRNEKLKDIEEKLSSDPYMLFKDIYTLFYNTEIVGLFCFDTKEMASKAVQDQSFFKSFPKDIRAEYIDKAERIMTIGHLLVHPAWRRNKIGVGLSDILVWFMHQRFVDSGCDLMIYWTRNNRGTNDLGIKFGGEAIRQGLDYGGLEADIIATRPDKVVMDCGDEFVNELGARLWANQINGHISAELIMNSTGSSDL